MIPFFTRVIKKAASWIGNNMKNGLLKCLREYLRKKKVKNKTKTGANLNKKLILMSISL
jgi:hypothetical protein